MNRQALTAGIIAVLAVTALVGGILFSTRNNRVDLTGEVLKVRSHQMDADHTIVLLDVRLRNPSTQQFLVKEVEVLVEEPGGKTTPAEIFADADVQRVLDYYPVLGQKYNPGLVRRDKIDAGKSVDRTISMSVPMTDERLGQRSRMQIVIHDSDGPTAKITERK